MSLRLSCDFEILSEFIYIDLNQYVLINYESIPIGKQNRKTFPINRRDK